METTDTARSKTAESGSDGEASRGASTDGAKGTRRKLNDQQEREVTRLYAETETPVSEISKRFGIGESSVYRVAQRHGAALRGRTATAASRPAAKTAAKAATAGRAGRGRAATKTAAKTTAKTAAKSAAKTAGKTAGKTAAKSAAKTPAKTAAKSAAKTAAKTPSTNGRRTPATRGRPAGTPAKRAAATTTRATRGPRAKAAVIAGTRRQFRVSYTAVRVFVAASMADAIRLAEAAGATDVTGIERS